MGLKKNVFTLHIPPWAPYTYDFVVLFSLTRPRKILLVVLQIGKAKDLSAPLRSTNINNTNFLTESTLDGVVVFYYTVKTGWMLDDDLERMWKEAVVA
jgi:hypothetical protein